nr:hypothetical protein [candidate division KSB1 bacterium]NIT71869.1 hypothetical protein [candidate division KSB1 bacterium]NIW69989.1 hypothetical protein [candidate division KSB1 bacterium]NIX71549.1 hypothetical protein [candidate division KSB1 bacterium]
YLSRKDKWYLGGGNRLIWAPPFPLFLDYPGYWDNAQFYNYDLQPVFTVAILDESGNEIPLRFADREWYPHGMVQSYQSVSDLKITEQKALTANDCLTSEFILTNWSNGEKKIWLILWTAQETFPSQQHNFIDQVEYEEEMLTFYKHLRYRDQPVVYPIACVLAINQPVQSYAVNLSEGAIRLPRWDYTPFYEQISEGKLNNKVNLSGITDDGIIYMALHCEVSIAPQAEESVVLGFSAAKTQEEAKLNLSQSLKTEQPLKTSKANWTAYFNRLPSFQCDDEYFQKYYWYRWYGLRLFTIPGGEDNYLYPAVCEGLSNFRVPITYSAQCHILETRWMDTPDIAQGSLLNFIHNQKEDGNFIGHVFPQWLHEESFYHANWANIELLQQIHPDDDFLKQAYQGLEKYLDYFDRKRDKENSGLYDIQNHYETGQEYMHRYVAVEQQADLENWGEVFRLKGVDVTVYMYEIKKMMVSLAKQFGKNDEAQNWQAAAENIKQAILEQMWSAEEEMFFDINPHTWERTNVKATVCFYPYFTDIVDESHLPGLKKHLLNPDEFWTPYPAPSSSVDDPYFDAEARWKGKRMNCPWNGRVWPMTNSHVAEALAVSAIRFNDSELKEMTVQFISKFIKMMFYDGDVNRPNCYEHYNPFNGKASVYRGVDDYQHSWVVDLIIKYVCGVRPQGSQLVVDPLPFPLNQFAIDRIPLKGKHVKVERHGEKFSVWIDGQLQGESSIGQEIKIPMANGKDR